MGIDQGQVMSAVAGAAGGSTALGIGFVTISAGILKISGITTTAPRSLARLGMVAFLSAMTSSLLAMVWLIAAVGRKDVSNLAVVYVVAVALFVVSAVIFLAIFVVAVRLLWGASTTRLLNQLGAKLVDPPPGSGGVGSGK
jgi:hypothetical protein